MECIQAQYWNTHKPDMNSSAVCQAQESPVNQAPTETETEQVLLYVVLKQSLWTHNKLMWDQLGVLGNLERHRKSAKRSGVFMQVSPGRCNSFSVVLLSAWIYCGRSNVLLTFPLWQSDHCSWFPQQLFFPLQAVAPVEQALFEKLWIKKSWVWVWIMFCDTLNTHILLTVNDSIMLNHSSCKDHFSWIPPPHKEHPIPKQVQQILSLCCAWERPVQQTKTSQHFLFFVPHEDQNQPLSN